MNVTKTVQFRTVADVLTAYQSRAVAPWAVLCGKQFMFKYEGGDLSAGEQLLAQVLNTLMQSAAIYTLAVYEPDLAHRQPKSRKGDEDRVIRIKSDTPYDGSFNFQLNDYNALYGVARATSGDGAVLDKILKAIEASNSRQQAIEDRLADLEDQADGEGGDDMLGKIGRILENPVIAGLVSSILEPKGPAAISGPPGILDEPGRARLDKAVERLLVHDPGLVGHLEKLANLAETRPGKFKLLLNSLAFL